MNQGAGDEPEVNNVRIGVLGPFEVSQDARPVPVTAGRLRTLLAVLAISAGRAVPVPRLALALWGDDPPGNVRRSVQTYLARLRGALGSELIATGPGGYRLCIDPEQVDALRFIRLLDTAAADPSAQHRLLAEAVAMWRGTPFDGVPSAWLHRTEAPRLLERYLAAVEHGADLDLGASGHSDLVPRLYELTAQHPLRESLWVRLLTALQRGGRPAEALHQYETIRRRLAGELGTDPCPQLRRIHAELLAGESPPPPPGPAPEVPRQLPCDIPGFTGRQAALKALDNLAGRTDQPAGPVVITAIAGTAGIGKTALAIHWAHQVADRFPDGQLYLNLRGFDPTGQIVQPADAIRGFLDALGVPLNRIPSGPDAQAALYRSTLAARRVLIVLDNARDAEQVRPLLPGTPTCLVLVTSRNQLTSLVATEAAHPLVLDVLATHDARDLLAHRLGPDRVAAEPEATDQIIDGCAGLPLALAIVAARAATRTGLPLRALAAQLRDEHSRLDTLSTDDPTTDARAVFSWSYQALGAQAAALFRLLGLHCGPDLSADAAASLSGQPPALTRRQLAELTRTNLLIEHLPGRYMLHDLLRAYAAELVHTRDPDEVRRDARHRMLDHYLHAADRLATRLNPNRAMVALPPPQPGLATTDIPDEQALDWFASEHAVLLAAVTHAAGAGFHRHAWQLAASLYEALERRGRWRESLEIDRIAIESAVRVGEWAAVAQARLRLGRAYVQLRQCAQAHRQLRAALDLFVQLDDVIGQTRVHINLAHLLTRQARHADAIDNCQRALALSRASGFRKGEAMALNDIGWGYAHLGDYRQTLYYCRQARTLFQEIGDQRGAANAWDSLGYAHHHLREYAQAIRCYRHAVDLHHQRGYRFLEADSRHHLGDTYLAAGDPQAARAAWQQALATLAEIDHPDADQVRAKLRQQAGAPAAAGAPDTLASR